MKYTLLHITLIVTLGWTYAQPSRLTVQPNGKIATITQAIALADAGDTILVKPGTYREGNILINKSLVLIGESKPVLDAEFRHEVITVKARHVTISGFKIINSRVASMHDPAGIGAVEADFLVVRNNELVGTYFGIHVSNSNHIKVVDNALRAIVRSDHETGNGIHLWQCSNAVIKNNFIHGHRDGIYFEFVTNSVIDGNVSEGNLRYGLHFMFSNDDDYTNNTFKDNGAGVAVMYTKNVKMVNNRFEKNWGTSAYGLLLKDIRDSFVENNLFDQNTIGIYMEGTSRTSFKNNVFSKNGWAIKLQASCDDNVFSENNFQSNTFDMVTNGTMVLNTISHNYWDKYQGYDLNRDGIGDVPFRPVNLYAMIVERIPTAVLLWRSFLVFLLDRAERIMPAVTPENLKDDFPRMKPYDFNL
ncbi:MAG: nitrous oxide reductase family maturation protein NosD [Cyclobacteriaceae bacterium]|nr:nitrous oxide reductase family maturation protein NosD [Cyclobacteriaceae bacterium]UYN87943.1 MAG: nitrous oxide reductase family maturation protein NosD [Cyclobacteriaceae bacterium]